MVHALITNFPSLSLSFPMTNLQPNNHPTRMSINKRSPYIVVSHLVSLKDLLEDILTQPI